MKVYHTEVDLIIELEGLQRLWALRKRLVIPKDKIGQIYWESYFMGPALMSRRLLGTRMFFLYAGSFKIQGRWEFWYLKHAGGLFGVKAPNTMSIDTVNYYEFDSVRITIDEEKAKELTRWGDPHAQS